MDASRGRRPGEATFAVLMLIFSLAALYQAYRISGFSALSSPGSFPMAAASIMTVAALVSLLNTLATPAASRQGRSLAGAFLHEITPKVVILFVAVIAVFAATLETLGFLLAAYLFLTVSIWLLYRRGPLVSLLVALGAVIGVYIVFRLVFKVVLPEGLVPEREIMAWIEDLFTARGPR